MNPDGTGVTNLTRRYTDPDWSPLGIAEGNPEWSPDGTKITFTSSRSGQDDVWAVDAPPATPGAPVALLSLSLGTEVAWAASAPCILTPGSGVPASSPDWRTVPSGGGTACTIKDTSKANTLNGTPGADSICAKGGNDTVYGGGGADVITGQSCCPPCCLPLCSPSPCGPRARGRGPYSVASAPSNWVVSGPITGAAPNEKGSAATTPRGVPG